MVVPQNVGVALTVNQTGIEVLSGVCGLPGQAQAWQC